MNPIYSVSDSFKLLVEPGSLTEVRALLRSKENPEETICRNQYYFGREHEKLAKDIDQFEKEDCVGIYFVTGSLKPEAYARNSASWRPPFQTKVQSSNKSEVVRRKLLLIDCDSNRPSGLSATDNERSFAGKLAQDVIHTLSVLGFSCPIVGDSGNGYHVIYAIDLPADGENEGLVKEFLSELGERCFSQGAKVDPVTWDSQRMVRLYGTYSKKGESTSERPHRRTGIVSHGIVTQSVREANSKAIQFAVSVWREQNGTENETIGAVDLAKRYLEKVEPAVQGHNGSATTFRVAVTLLEGFGLNRNEANEAIADWNSRCQPPWSEYDLEHKFNDAEKKVDHSKIGHMVRKSDMKVQIDVKPPEGKKDATVEDLIRLNKSIQWIWEGWIQRGVLVGLASQPGVGKTRTCADLVKRISMHLPWPDGSPPTLDKGSKVIWVCCDNQWGEIASFPEAYGIPADAIYLNSWDDDPTTGTVFDNEHNFKNLEERIKRTGAQLVLVDTVMNSTSHNTMRPEDGIKYFKPLADIAQRTNTTIMLVTHLSSNGEPLGRRIEGQVRQMISIERFDGEPRDSPRRRMYIYKSNSIFPPELEVTLQSDGSEYRQIGQQAPAVAKSGDMSIIEWGKKLASSGKLSKALAFYIATNVGYTKEEIEAAKGDNNGNG